MKNLHKYLLIGLVACALISGLVLLTPTEAPDNTMLSAETRATMRRKGFSYHSTLGTPELPLTETWFTSSAKAAVKASWREKGQQKIMTLEKRPGDYAVVMCQLSDNDSFVVIFSK